MSLLVVGVKTKSATQSIDWEEIDSELPAFGDFDRCIIYTPSLTERLIANFAVDFEKEFSSKIYRAIITGTKVFCITSPNSYIGANLFPFSLDTNIENGKNFDRQAQGPYLSKLKGWSHWFIDSMNNGVTGHPTYTWEIRDQLKTKHQGLVAFDVVRVHYYTNQATTTPVSFLPPVTSLSPEQNIELLLQGEGGPDINPTLPSNVKALQAVGEKELMSRRLEITQQLSNLSTELEKLNEDLRQLEFKKGILSFKHRHLVRAVVKVSGDMEIRLDGNDEHQEDKTLRFSAYAIPVEIKGHDKGADQHDLIQIFSRCEKAITPEGCKVKGILIVNGWIQDGPKGSKHPVFSSDLASKAAPWGIRLIETRELFKMWQAYTSGKEIDPLELILKDVGILTYEE